MIVLTLILLLAVVGVISLIAMYNKLVSVKNETKNAWSGIDVQLKRRHDLIPNLVEAVKGYLTHERTTLENVIKARQQALSASGSVAEQSKAENFLTQTLRSLFAVVESYPNLKANQNIQGLQDELISTENKISFARNNYNDWANNLNKMVEQFPTNVIASMFNFEKAEFFEMDSTEKQAPKVQF